MLSSGLVLHFLLYGAVYMSSTVGFISAHVERKSFFALTRGMLWEQLCFFGLDNQQRITPEFSKQQRMQHVESQCRPSEGCDGFGTCGEKVQ